MSLVNEQKVSIVGAGQMGSGIAITFALAGYSVLVLDIKDEFVKSGLKKIEDFLERSVKKEKITTKEKQAILGRVSTSTSMKEAADSFLVVEAATENLEIKLTIFKELDELCDSETILASNTSTYSIAKIASVTNRPEKVIGMHFFIPAPVMKLVEVIPGIKTSSGTTKKVVEIGGKIGKKVAVAPDSSGFIVNRLLVPMWNEAANLVAEGTKPEDIDIAMKNGANLPMGPLELADFAGLDTTLSVMEEMYAYFGDPKFRPSPLLRKMVDAGLYGRKTGEGFYKY